MDSALRKKGCAKSPYRDSFLKDDMHWWIPSQQVPQLAPNIWCTFTLQMIWMKHIQTSFNFCFQVDVL